MQEPQFRDLLEAHLVPMFAGTALGDTCESDARHSLVAFEHPCSIFMKPAKELDYRVPLVRSQPFAEEEKELVRLFIHEVSEFAFQPQSHFFDDVLAAIPRRVIGKLLSPQSNRTTLQRAVRQFESLASQTYEGHPIVAALGITGSAGHGSVRLEDLWKEDFSAVLSNGFDSMYVCGADGLVFNLKVLSQDQTASFAPQRLGAIANWCDRDNRVALVLNRNGEILVFKNEELVFAKRRGAWKYYAHESMIKRLGVGTNAEVRRAVYESCLDVSFARTGGCVAVLASSELGKVTTVVKERDLVREASQTRTKLLASIVRGRFQSLDRRLRQELLAMDGAVVLSHRGDVLTAGAIVKVPGGSTGGGRRAAAKRLSKLGLGIKVSADGPIEGFRREEDILTM